MRLSVLLCFSTLAVLITGPKDAFAQMSLYDEAGRSHQQSVWQIDAQTTYYQATANYTPGGGQYNSLANGNDYKLIDFDFGARWAPARKWSLYGSTRVSNAESDDGVINRRNSTFTQVVLGGDYSLYLTKKNEVLSDFSLTLPLQRVDVTADEVLNREGAIEASGRVIGRTQWKRLNPFAFLGFTYRDENRASLLPYGLGAEMQFSQLALGAEIRGYETVIKDKHTNNRLEREVVATKNGGTLRYFSVNPSLLETNLWIRGRLFENWGYRASAGSSLTGAGTSAGWNMALALNYSFDEISKFRSPPRPYQPVEETTKFQEETNDGVDQNLFKIPPPPPPPPKPNPEQVRQKMQNDLDQTEMQIELKQIKKKKKRR